MPFQILETLFSLFSFFIFFDFSFCSLDWIISTDLYYVHWFLLLLSQNCCYTYIVNLSFQWLCFSAWFLLIPSFFFFNFELFALYWGINNVIIVSGEPWRDSAMHIYVSTVPQAPLPSRLPHNIEQSSLWRTIGPCWLPILNRAECVYDHFKLPNYPLTLATISSFYKSVSLFLIHSISQLIELLCSLIVFLIFFAAFSMFSFNFWVVYLKRLF